MWSYMDLIGSYMTILHRILLIHWILLASSHIRPPFIHKRVSGSYMDLIFHVRDHIWPYVQVKSGDIWACQTINCACRQIWTRLYELLGDFDRKKWSYMTILCLIEKNDGIYDHVLLMKASRAHIMCFLSYVELAYLIYDHSSINYFALDTQYTILTGQ